MSERVTWRVMFGGLLWMAVLIWAIECVPLRTGGDVIGGGATVVSLGGAESARLMLCNAHDGAVWAMLWHDSNGWTTYPRPRTMFLSVHSDPLVIYPGDTLLVVP